MRPMMAATMGALISGVAMYAVGTRAQSNPFAELPALVQTVDGRYIQIPDAKAVGFVPGYATALQPAAAPVLVQQAPLPQRTVYRTAQPVQERVGVERAAEPRRSWAKTALVIGGSTGAGAGVGGLVGGKKGAWVVPAIGGGPASIYEATRRR